MNRISLSRSNWLTKSGVFLLFLLVETMVFAIITLSPYLSKSIWLGFHTSLTVILIFIALLLRRSEKRKPYWPVFYVLFVAGAAVLISGLFSDNLLDCGRGICLRSFIHGLTGSDLLPALWSVYDDLYGIVLSG